MFLWRNRVEVQSDQVMRERGEGDSALTNPHIQVRLGLLQSWSRLQSSTRATYLHIVRIQCVVYHLPTMRMMHSGQLRQRYRKIYEDFVPRYMYWKEVLLLRKLLFAAIVVMVNRNIELQYVWEVCCTGVMVGLCSRVPPANLAPVVDARRCAEPACRPPYCSPPISFTNGADPIWCPPRCPRGCH